MDDPRLRFISDLWVADGQLDFFAAWLWETPAIYNAERMEELTGHKRGRGVVTTDPRWLEEVRARALTSGVQVPIGGGWDPLHLSVHSSAPLERATTGATLLRSGSDRREATLVLDSMAGWYSALAGHGNDLTPLGDRSWRVDVFVRPVGWLGTFRRSRETGLWFSGRHRHHVRGV